MSRFLVRAAASAAMLVFAACGDNPSNPKAPTPPTPPTAPPLPLAGESANFRYYFSPGDAVEVERQEAFHVWAVGRLGVAIPTKIDYRKYASHGDMAARTGRGNTNAYAEPEAFTIHTLWSFDNHEVVHIYTALVGRPSEFFNEGIAVAFQTNPLAGDFEPRFDGEPLDDAVRRYRLSGQLVLPLSRMVTTSGFRGISDTVLSYRESGSFVSFLITRFGLDRFLQFFRASGRDDSLAVIEQRFQQSFGSTLAAAEADWLAVVG